MKSNYKAPPQKGDVISRIYCYLVTCVLLVIALTVSVSAGSDVKDILTRAERLWLSENNSRIVLAVETTYAPFVFLDAQDQPAGLAHEFLLLIESKIGVHFKQRRFSSLDDIFAKVRNGEVQVVNAVTKTPWRSGFISFTDPFISVPSVIVVRSERLGRMETSDLSGLKVSLVKSYAVTEFLEKKRLGFETDLVADDLAGLLNVSFKRSDATVVDLATASYLITKSNITNLRVAGEAAFEYHLSMGVSNSEPILHGILQKGLSAITESERQEIRKRWVNPTGQNILFDQRLWLAAAGFLLLITGIITWNRVLRLEVHKKTRAILESAAQYQLLATRQEALLTAVPDIIMELDINKVYTWANSAGFEFFGEDVIGKNYRFYFVGEQNTYEIVQPLYEGTEKLLYVESLQRRIDGEVRLLAWWYRALVDEQGAVTGILSTARDITESKEYEKELQQKNAELERFTYTVSHDLKSPIITIKGFTGSLEKDLAKGNYERMAGDLKRVSDAADKMVDLLRDLLELSTIGRIIKAPEAVDMNLLVGDVLAQLAGPLKNRNLTVAVQPGLPEVLCDKRRMAEVLQNLLENAINYMGDQADPQIQLGMREEAGEHIFFVQDNGIGIDEKYHKVIFGLFNKLDSESGGTGIGLALVKRIIEVHGGRVWVESEGEGMGSCFCFTIKEATK